MWQWVSSKPPQPVQISAAQGSLALTLVNAADSEPVSANWVIAAAPDSAGVWTSSQTLPIAGSVPTVAQTTDPRAAFASLASVGVLWAISTVTGPASCFHPMPIIAGPARTTAQSLDLLGASANPASAHAPLVQHSAMAARPAQNSSLTFPTVASADATALPLADQPASVLVQSAPVLRARPKSVAWTSPAPISTMIPSTAGSAAKLALGLHLCARTVIVLLLAPVLQA
jgi:hypothetical protein